MADIYDALKPTLFVSKVFGLAPFSYDAETRNISVSKLHLAFSVLILVLFSANSAWVMYDLMFNDLDKQDVDHIAEVNRACQTACGIGVAIITILLAIIQRNKLTQVVNSIHQINHEMRKLNIAVPYQNLAKVSLIQLVCLFIYLILLTIHASFVWIDSEHYLDTWIACLAPPFYNFLMEFQFISAALLLKRHFNLLNDYLTTFTGNPDAIEGTKQLSETYVDGNDTFLGPKLIDTSFTAWDGNFSRFRPRKDLSNGTSEKQTQLSKIKIFRKIHSSLCDVKEHLNSAFSLQLLAGVAQAFVIITSDLYLLFTTLSDSGLEQIAWLTYPVAWTVTHVFELIFVVVTCTKTSKQANQTAVVVHKLLARDCDPDLRNQLKLFSIQLLHRKISFTACGFFTLDMTLLQAIIGAATTYLVILIQFHLGQKPNQTP